jgi:hypothetical protein
VYSPFVHLIELNIFACDRFFDINCDDVFGHDLGDTPTIKKLNEKDDESGN